MCYCLFLLCLLFVLGSVILSGCLFVYEDQVLVNVEMVVKFVVVVMVVMLVVDSVVQKYLVDYVKVKFIVDFFGFDVDQKKMFGLLIDVVDIINVIYWQQFWGDKVVLMVKISDLDVCVFVEFNYGLWN